MNGKKKLKKYTFTCFTKPSTINLCNGNYVSLIRKMANDQYLTRITFAYTFLSNANMINTYAFIFTLFILFSCHKQKTPSPHVFAYRKYPFIFGLSHCI